MAYILITLDQAKSQLRINHALEDDLLTLYIDSALEYIKGYLNQDIPTDVDEIVPSDIKHAALLIVADAYENREGAGEKEIKANPAVINLLYPYRVEVGV